MAAILAFLGFIFIAYIIGCFYVAGKVYKNSGFFMTLGFFVLCFLFTPFLGNFMHKNTNDPPGLDEYLSKNL